MPQDERIVYWDACCFLSYVNGDEDRIEVLETLLDYSGVPSAGTASRLQIVTSTLSIVEVAFATKEKSGRLLDPSELQQIDDLWTDRYAVRLVEFYDRIAFEARLLIRQAMQLGWSLHAADAVHLATAKQYGVAEFHTYEPGLVKYKELVGFEIGVPTTVQSVRVRRPPTPITTASSSESPS